MSNAAAPSLAALAGHLPGLTGNGDWLRFREAALEKLLRLGLPSRRDDGFKYANLRLLERRTVAPVAPIARTAAGDAPGDGAVLLVDGHPAHPLPTPSAGLSIAPLADTLARTAPGELPWLGLPGDSGDERLRLWAAACLGDGLVIRVAAGATIAEPLTIRHLARGAGSYPRLYIELGAGASLTLIEEHASAADADSVTVAVTDLVLGADARLAHVRVQEAGGRAVVLDDTRVEVGSGAHYAHHAHAFGAQLDRLDLRVRLAGRGAEADLRGLFLAGDGRSLHVRTAVTHEAPDTRSTQTYRGIAGARGRGSYDGKVIVAHGAARANSRQSSRNLLLARDAEIDTRPQLEIYTDDVQCSHGATTGTLDEQMLFYLLSRGIDPATARGLLTHAFAADVVAAAPTAALREMLSHRLETLLPSATGAGEAR